MVNTKVFIVGGTGETGSSIITGLLKAGFDNVHALVRPSSLEKPVVASLKDRGVQIHAGDIADPLDKLVPLLEGVDTVITSVGAGQELTQIHLADAAKAAGVKRFVPTLFGTVVPVGGIMAARDRKEDVLNHIRQIWLPYTAIEVGFWYQISIPPVPSGKLNHGVASLNPNPIIYGDGNTKNALTDLRDVGTWVARIIQDDRTLNRYVLAYTEVLSQNEISELVEKLTGEKVEAQIVSKEQLKKEYDTAVANYKANPDDFKNWMALYGPQYSWSKFIRGDNTPDYAEYLGYIDAKKLFTDVQLVSIESFVKEVLAGPVHQVYGGRFYQK